jgi:hypothetical protein
VAASSAHSCSASICRMMFSIGHTSRRSSDESSPSASPLGEGTKETKEGQIQLLKRLNPPKPLR